MTNQASEELREIFINRMWNYFGIEDKSELAYFGTIYDEVVNAIIRTEKLKLLDALEAKAQEYIVIGEQLRGFPYFITVDNIKAERNKLEAEL